MVDHSAPGTNQGELASPTRSVLSRIGIGAIFILAIVLPGLIVAFGILYLLLSPFGDTPLATRDMIAGGAFLCVMGGVFMIPGALFFLRRRRNKGRRRSPKAIDEDTLLHLAIDPSITPSQWGRLAAGDESLDHLFGTPVTPEPVAVILPFSLHSRPWNGRPWWLAPLVFFGVPIWMLIRGNRITNPGLVFVAVSVGLGLIVGALQYAYVYRRRIIVDDLNLTYVNMFGRTKTISRGEVRRIALRTFLERTGAQDRLFFIGLNGDCIMRVARFGFPYEEAERLAAVLQVPIDRTWDRPTTLKTLRTEFPGAATWSEQHRLLYSLIVMIPILGFTLGLTLLRYAR